MNTSVISSLKSLNPKYSVPETDTVNLNGNIAYSIDEKTRLVAMLNTIKLHSPQYYRNINTIVEELYNLISVVGKEDPLFLAQAIVYSRCIAGGMRTINHVAAAMAAPYLSGMEFASRFYGPFDRINAKSNTHHGGCIYRPDDMYFIKDAYKSLNSSTLSNAMKKGFAKAIQSFDAYQIAKYQKYVRDIVNLVHPKNCKAQDVINLVMSGENVSADTWETKNSQSGEIVANMKKSGMISEDEAEEMLAEAKNNNWKELLVENKLGYLAALRNIRSILKNPDETVVSLWCELITNIQMIQYSLVNPLLLDMSYIVVYNEFSGEEYTPRVLDALKTAYKYALPNITNLKNGKTLIIQDCSGSMSQGISVNNRIYPQHNYTNNKGINTCSRAAALLTATIAKVSNADIIQFGNYADYISYNKNKDVFTLADSLVNSNMGGTNLHCAFKEMLDHKTKYDRIFIISDNEVNGRIDHTAILKQYYTDVCIPQIYNIDLCAYGTKPVGGKNVHYYFGYNFEMLNDVSNFEFNPSEHMDKIRNIKI